jgi:hypothetical protein
MIRTATLSILVIVAALALAPELEAQEKKGKEKKAKVEAQVHVGFSTSERQIIVEFFGKHPYTVESLPPGIAKNLARGKPLPPGIAKKHIPTDLKARLPARVGVEITIFGDRIVLLEASGAVVDILEDVFR